MIKTFPKQINFHWKEWEGDFFDCANQKIINTTFVLMNGAGVILNGQLFHISTFDKLIRSQEYKKLIRNITQIKILFSNRILFLTDIWSTGPYHFYVDLLSRIIGLKENFNIDLGKKKIILFNDNFTINVILPLFNLLDLKFKDIILINKNDYFLVLGRNFYITRPHITGTNNPFLTKRINEIIWEKLPKSVQYKDVNKVYYYRRNRFRKVVNDNELINKLSNAGFYCTDFDELSYLEARYLMQNVKIFVGIHGGGLTNMIFMKQGGFIVEIKTANPNPNNHCYFELAKSLNHDYTMFVAHHVGDHWTIEGKGCDVLVDVNLLCSYLETIQKSISTK